MLKWSVEELSQFRELEEQTSGVSVTRDNAWICEKLIWQWLQMGPPVYINIAYKSDHAFSFEKVLHIKKRLTKNKNGSPWEQIPNICKQM